MRCSDAESQCSVFFANNMIGVLLPIVKTHRIYCNDINHSAQHGPYHYNGNSQTPKGDLHIGMDHEQIILVVRALQKPWQKSYVDNFPTCHPHRSFPS